VKKSDEKTEDLQIFRDAMRDVKKLIPKKQRVTQPRPKITLKRRQAFQETLPTEHFAFSDYEKLPSVGADDLIGFARSGIDQKTLRNLRRGQYNPSAALDLHGKTTDEARLALDHFLLACQQQKIHCALIVHGRGTGVPVLKNRLNHWLRQTPFVLAFCSINKGALHVLLRRKAF